MCSATVDHSAGADRDDDTGREMWATYSVKDHLDPRALALDVLLFDRLVFPVPEVARMEGDPTQRGPVIWTQNPEAVAHWKREWRLDKQSEILKILGPVARKVSWSKANVEKKSFQEESARLAKEGVPDYAFHATRTALTRDLAEFVNGVAVLGPAFRSYEAADRAFGFTNDRGRRVLSGEFLPVLLTWELLLPNIDRPDLKPERVLKEAVDFVRDNGSYRNSRTAFVKWQRSFVRDGVTSRESFDAAATRMRELVKELESETRRIGIGTVARKVCQFLPVAVPVGVAAATGGEGALIAGTGLTAWMAGEAIERWLFGERNDEAPVPSAFVFDAQQRFRRLLRR